VFMTSVSHVALALKLIPLNASGCTYFPREIHARDEFDQNIKILIYIILEN
jgi:hypothetical protein